ncbi:MAG: class E sortase [Actinomycetota bacterium]
MISGGGPVLDHQAEPALISLLTSAANLGILQALERERTAGEVARLACLPEEKARSFCRALSGCGVAIRVGNRYRLAPDKLQVVDALVPGLLDLAAPVLPPAPVAGSPGLRQLLRGGLSWGAVLVGLSMVLYACWSLWGTALAQAGSQEELRRSLFKDRIVSIPRHSLPELLSGTEAGFSEATDFADPVTDAFQGEAVAIIRIPRIGIDQVVVEGTSVADLRLGPGHYSGTPLPGHSGNSAIAGHRTTYGAPFRRLNELKVGDEILIQTKGGKSKYVISGSTVVLPDDTRVLAQVGKDRLTLTTCDPPFSAARRLVVSAELK